jgi:uncharacterized membrane protein YhaH (DUF805 family)
MGFVPAVQSALKKYVTFKGRACRSEFWWFLLFSILCMVGSAFLAAAIDPSAMVAESGEGSASVEVNSPIIAIVMLLFILPQISITVRRLHDIGRSGWAYFAVLIPLVGPILMLIWTCKKGTDGENKFGADPLAPAAS